MSKQFRRFAALALSALLAVTAAGCGKKEEESSDAVEPNSSLGLTLGYMQGLTVANDPDALQRAVDEAYESAASEGLPLEYQEDAFSSDGRTYTCYIANPASSDKDIFVAIYGDAALNDELFISQLIPPGMAMDTITLNHPLNPGVNPVSVVFTQIEVEDGAQVINNQATVSMRFVYEQ